jgi:hypothetical protein
MKTLLACILAIAWTSSPAWAEDPLAGAWKITDAKTLSGKPYTGSVDIMAKGKVYQLRWDTTAGKYTGIGMTDGNRLCVAWGSKDSGAVLYKLGGDGALDGRWTVPGATDEGTEKATGGTPGEFAGEYSIKGTNPGGKGGYEGKLSIQKSGEVYQLKWTIPGSPSYAGVGIQVGDSLYVGWSTAKDTYAVIGYTFEGLTAQGVWTVSGAKTTAQENLTK